MPTNQLCRRFANPGIGGNMGRKNFNLTEVSIGAFKQVLQNIAVLFTKRCNYVEVGFSTDHVDRKRNNSITAHSKIMDA